MKTREQFEKFCTGWGENWLQDIANAVNDDIQNSPNPEAEYRRIKENIINLSSRGE